MISHGFCHVRVPAKVLRASQGENLPYFAHIAKSAV